MKNSKKEISVILPTLNEELNLKIIIPKIVNMFVKEMKIKYEILVVDDGSDDNTNTYMNKISNTNSSIKYFPRSNPRSLPLSILDGIKLSRYENVMWLDADGSMNESAMKKLLIAYFNYLDSANEKVIIGSRFIEGGGYKGVKDVKTQSLLTSIQNVRKSNDSVFGMLLSIIINKFLSYLFKTNLTDLTSGFIVLRKQHIDNTVFENKEYGEYFIYLIDSLIKKGLQIEEVGYVCETRLHGSSKTGSSIIKFIIRGIPYIKAARLKGSNN